MPVTARIVLPRLSFVVRAAVVGTLILASSFTLAAGGPPRYDPGSAAFAPVGARPERGYFSTQPWDRVDLVNGNLTLTFTDLVLPGNAGMDLRITRTYRHQTDGFEWSFGFTSLPTAVIAMNPGDPPELVMADRSTRKLHAGVVSGYWITTDFWRYDAASRTLYLPNGWVATYHAPWLGWAWLQDVHDAYGNALTPEWGSQPHRLNRVTQTVNDEGATRTRTVVFNYPSGHDVPDSMTYEGRTWTYGYESTSPGRLTSAQSPTGTGPAWTFSYGGASLTVTTPMGGTVGYTFQDQDGRAAVQAITTGGRAIDSGTWTLAYVSGSTTTTTVTTPASRQRMYVHTFVSDGPDGVEWLLQSESLIANGTVVSSLSRSFQSVPFLGGLSLRALQAQTLAQDGQTFTTAYEYNAPNFADYLEPKTMTESSTTTSETRVTTRTFDDAFTSGYILPKVASTAVRVDGESVTTNFGYDHATGFLTSQTTAGRTTTFGPDSRGNTAAVTDADGHATTIQFQGGVPQTVTTPGSVTVRTLNLDGTVAAETRAGVGTGFEYDGLGRVRVVTPPEGAATNTDYASDGTTVTVSRAGASVTTTVDGFGRPIETVNAAGVRTTTRYDREGRTTFQSQPFTTNEVGNHYDYDALGRVTKVTHADNTYVAYIYGGTTVTIEDENHHTTTQTWAAFGTPGDARLSAVTDAKGAVWTYSYNVLGKLTSVHGPAGADRIWQYADPTQLQSETQPESGTTSYTYDTEGLLHTKTDAANRTTTYSYDGDHRLTGIDVPGTADDVTFTFDARGDRTIAASASVTTTFEYDTAHRMRSRTDWMQGQAFITRFSYDARDNLTTITYPSGRIVTYSYDAASRVSQVTLGGQVLAHDFSYQSSGALGGFTYGNSQTMTATSDGRGRPSHLTSGPLDLTYGYDNVGNVTSVTDPRSGYSSTFSYDELDRLTGVTGFGGTSFDYDAQGNRRTKGTGTSQVTYTYHATTNRLMSASGGSETGTFTYDDVGNLRTDPTGAYPLTFTYTSRNQLATVQPQNGPITNYLYDADGLRAVKSSVAGQQYYVHGPGGQLLAEYAALLMKIAPTPGAIGANPTVTLKWSALANATFEVCWDTSNNTTCEGTWQSAGTATQTTLTSLTPGTYYWQVRATTASGTALADNGLWWSFTVAEGGFLKVGPASGITGLSTVTLQWSAMAGDPSYWFCFDTTNNNSCDSFWWPNGGTTSVYWDGLAPGTYYWQARVQLASGQVFDADGGTWWSFTIGGGGAGFGKQTPAPGLSGLPSTVRVQWTPVPNEGYWVCWDQTDNGQCDTDWWPNGGQTWKDLENLAPGTYYWQVKTADVPMEADGGIWWAFTVGTPPVTFGKQTPAAGAILTTNATMLWWDAAPGAQYYEVCVDTINNGLCDTQWELNGVAVSRLLAGLTDGTYYWQVRAQTATGPLYANVGAWWSVTIDAPDPIREYIYLGNTLLATVNLTTGTPVVSYYHTDALGSVRAITNATGALVGPRIDYGAFGETTAPLVGDPRKYIGGEVDPETAFEYLGARYYRNLWGRFTSVDPVVSSGATTNPQLWNRYGYGLNSPLRFSDPSGMEPQDPGGSGSDTPTITLPGREPKGCLWGCGVDPVAFMLEGLYRFWLGPQRASGQQLKLDLAKTESNPVVSRDALQQPESFLHALVPDFFSVNANIGFPFTANIVGMTFALSAGRNGHIYFGFGPNVGRSLTFISASVTGNWLTQDDKLHGFLTRDSYCVAAGSLIGEQFSKTPGSGYSGGVGLFSPQIGFSVTYSFDIGKLFRGW